MTRTSRRRFLAHCVGAATAGTAGCSMLEDEESPPTVEPESVESILTEPTPEIEHPAPVQPTGAAVDGRLDRVDDLLARVPAEIGADRVPNGVVRREIERTRARAVDGLAAVEDARDRFRALRSTRPVSRYTREAAVALAAVDDGSLSDDVADERDDVRTTLHDRLEAVAYEGEDPHRTLLVAYRWESDLASARRRVSRPYSVDDPNALEVGDVAGRVESAATTVRIWDHLADRHADRADVHRDFESSYDAALERTLTTAREADLPPADADPSDLVDGDVDRLDVQFMLVEALRGVTRREETIAEDLENGRLGEGLRRAIGFERDRRAFESIVDRVEDDGVPAPTSADRVREEREAALAAADAAPVEPTDPSLAGHVLANRLQLFRRIDADVAEYADRDRPASLPRQHAEYAVLRAQLEALPAAVETVRGRLEAD